MNNSVVISHIIIFSKTGVSFANAANNLGLLMQKCGMMIPYDISLQFYD